MFELNAFLDQFEMKSTRTALRGLWQVLCDIMKGIMIPQPCT
jgi:hypothetical protein